MIKTLIVDDKPSSIELLRWLIKQHCPDIGPIVTAISVAEALPLIRNFEPDLVFLDIQMPRETGFDLLTKVEKWNFEVIFTTAYNEYAIQAIRFSALDYLLKPVTEEELVKAVDRYKAKRIYSQGGEELYRNFIQNISAESKMQRLALPGMSDIQYVALADIVRLQADRNYTRLFFMNKKDFLSSKTLLDYEKILQESGFLRVHKSHLVNSRHVVSYERTGVLKMIDGSEVEVSRRKKESLMQVLKTGG